MVQMTPSGLFLPAATSGALQYDPGGSLTWLKRLERRLSVRNLRLQTFDAYYQGHHKLQFATPKFRTTFGGLFNEFADNWCPLVVDAVTERLNPQGIRLGTDSDKGDKDAWYMWQANNLDSEIRMGFTEAVLREESYLLVWNDPDNEDVPLMTVEDPGQMIVAFSSENRRKRAAAAKFFDDDDGYPCATVYLPDGIYKYRSMSVDYRATDQFQSQLQYLRDMPAGGGSPNINLPIAYGGSGVPLAGFAAEQRTWVPREVDNEPWPLPNPLGVVPVVPIRNKPRLLSDPVSEIANIIPIQDAANKLFTDLLLASEFAAFQQRWATGLELPLDPVTGQPVAPPVGPGTLLTGKNENAKFGSFPEMTGAVHLKAIEMCVEHIASQSRTPAHYLHTGVGHFPSGEAIKSAETGLVAKVRDRMMTFGESLEEATRLAFAVRGDKRSKIVDSETIWRDPESRTESEHVDAVIKRIAIGVPLRQLQEDVGYTESQIERFRQMRRDEIIDYLTAQAFALQKQMDLGILPMQPGPGGAAAAIAGANGVGQASGVPMSLPNPVSSGQPQELIASPGSPATTVRGPRTTL